MMMKRWSSFGSGMLAYGIMSNLASRGHYHNHYYGNNYRSIIIISKTKILDKSDFYISN